MQSAIQKGLIVAGLLLLGASSANGAGEGLQILAPPGCLPGDGGPSFPVDVYVWGTGGQKGKLSLHSNQGSFEKTRDLGGGLYRARFVPPRLKKKGQARFAAEWTGGQRRIRGKLQVDVCPHPTGRVRVRAEPEKLLAGEGQQAFLNIQVTNPAGRPAPGQKLEITTNVGEIKHLRELGGGKYKAVFLPPGDPFPQVANVMVANPGSARLDRVAVGRAVIPITARIELPGKTRPRTRMEMKVAGRTFGPVKADRKGKFKLPILVPPGYGKGRATSIDRVGNRKVRTVDLFLPETNQLGLWGYPRLLPADGKARSRLLVTTIDKFGIPTDIGGVRIKASQGKVGQVKRVGKGLYEAYFTAPRLVGKGEVDLEVTFPEGGKKSRASEVIKLLPGPPDRVEFSVPDRLPADGVSAGSVVIAIHDKVGNPVGGQKVALKAAVGKVGEFKETRPGYHEGSLTAPLDPPRWTDRLQAEVRDIGGQDPSRIMVAASSLGTKGGQTFLETVLVDGTGRPVEGGEVKLEEGGRTRTAKTSAFGRTRFELTASGAEGPRRCLFTAGAGTIRRVVHLVEEKGGARLLPLDLDSALPPDTPLRRDAQVQLHPAPELNLVLETLPPAKGKTFWQVRAVLSLPDGKPAAGREVRFSVSGGRLGTVRETSAAVHQAELDPGPAGWGKIVISVVETQSHVGALKEIVESGGSR